MQQGQVEEQEEEMIERTQMTETDWEKTRGRKETQRIVANRPN